MDQDNMAQPLAGTVTLDVGHVISRTLSVYLGNLPAFLFMGLFVALIPIMFAVAIAGEGYILNTADLDNPLGPNGIADMLSTLLLMVLGAVLQGAVVYGSVKHLEGDRQPFRETVGKGLILALPLLGVSIVYAIGMTVTLALLVVPGLIFICVYTVVVPAAVVDKTGVFASFSRSAELTRGNRWRILLVLILSLLIAFLIFTVLSLVFGAMMAFLDNRSEIALVAVLMQVVINAIFMSAYACLTALLYMDLRKLKDGDLPTRISGVFD